MNILCNRTYNKLGDTLSIIIGLENCGRQNDLHFFVGGNNLFKDILSVFNFEYVAWSSDKPNFFVDSIFEAPNLKPWLQRFSCNFCESESLQQPESFSIPSIKVKRNPESITLIQFDSSLGNPLKIKETMDILAPGEKYEVVGGPQTTRYIKTNYRCGNFSYVCEQIANCQHFVGIDSGMSHIAGILGIKSNVVCVYPYWAVKRLYGEYPNITCHHPDNLPIEVPKIGPFARRAYKKCILFS